MKPVTTLVLLASATVVSLFAFARPGNDTPVLDRAGADLLPSSARRHVLAARASDMRATAAPTAEEVGDVDSFGRKVVWLGVTQGNVQLAATCEPPSDPRSGCQVLAAAPTPTAFNFTDLASIKLPGKASNSLLCYWFSPYLQVRYGNPTGTPAVARLTYAPSLTIESPVLDDPALIDPTTGAPFGGRLTSGMTSSERFETPLAPGMVLNERSRDSAVCIAGFLTRRSLVDLYGLTDAQAREVFRKPITVRLNVSGSVQYVDNASLVFGLRVVGD